MTVVIKTIMIAITRENDNNNYNSSTNSSNSIIAIIAVAIIKRVSPNGRTDRIPH